MKHQKYKKEHTEMKYLKNMQKKLKGKNNLLELEKNIKKLKNQDLRDRGLKFEKEVEGLFLNQLKYL